MLPRSKNVEAEIGDTISRQYPGLLMRPEHNETEAKTETRECKTKTETETETEISLVNSVAYENKTNCHAFVIDYIFEIINDE